MEAAKKVIGRSVPRVDAFDKVTGRTKYTEDICPKGAYVARILHASIAHGRVLTIDTKEAVQIPGVIKVVTCFDVPKHYFPTAGHPWSTDARHQDVADRLLLTERVRYYGDDIAAIIAENEIAAAQAIDALHVTYEEFPFVLEAEQAMEEGAPKLHEPYPDNVLGHTNIRKGNYEEAIREDGLIKVEGWYETPAVQHCHIENFICYAYEENNKIHVVASTQIPHIARRVVGQALGIPWGRVRIVKPYIGGGFGNKQDVLYEPLCAYLCTVAGGHMVMLNMSREETFACTRVRHGIKTHITSYVRKDGSFAARKYTSYSNQGAYASHGHGIAAKGMGAFAQLYPCENLEADCYTVFTNRPAAGAMRGYGIPQAMFATESHTDDIAKAIGMSPVDFRRKNLMPVGFEDAFSKNKNYFDSFNQCMDKAMKASDYERKTSLYKEQTGTIRKGIGLAVFWYNTAVWPISLESSSCRMVLNQDGSVQVQLGETEIGQGADTVFAQMTAETLGINLQQVHIVSCQDTDVTPFGTGAYASRQTYVAGFVIKQTAELLKEKILGHAQELLQMDREKLDIRDGNIVDSANGSVLWTLSELSTEVLYSLSHSQHLTSESTYQIQSNAYSFGCTVAEVEVDMEACKIQLTDIINVHDCGTLINPALAEAQVHGGMSMGIGYGLSEVLKFDPKTGRLLNGNLLDYKLSTTMDHPRLRADFVENPEPTSAYGTKALGEPPVCSVAPAIRNALLLATGVAVNEIPISPHVLYKEFQKGGLLDV